MNIKPQTTTDNFDLSWIEKDVQCWIYQPNQESGPIYIKGVIKSIIPLNFNKSNSKVTCILQNGLQYDTKAVCLQKRRHSNSIQRDLISLDVINPAQILYQLRKRLEDKKIHTFMWNSLIIVNPFVRISGMYDEKVMKIYHDKIITQKKSMQQLQPHVYGFVCEVLNNMRESQKCQMISISGQSGSGKTQTNKQCLKIISYICQSHLRTTELIQSFLIQERIINCDSVLQCFGNSKTSKNDNSSRFGKLVTEKINAKQMQIIECEIKVFFLEKSRIVHQSPAQRNFHIFYLLLAFCPDNLKTHLGFKNKSGQDLRLNNFNYIQKISANIREQDRHMWSSLNQSFHLLDINQGLKKQIFQIIAAVLHLGNLHFDQSSLTDNEPCQITNEELVPLIAGLLSMDTKTLKEGLLTNKRQIAGDILYTPLAQKQCIQNRDSIAKSLYENLFLWIVQQLNKKVNENSKPKHNIKIVKMLDIYGFQVFDHNSFEQLCVNYTNQRMHQLYLDQVFKHEKNLLKKQGLQSIIPQMKFTDNAKIIQLLDTNAKSIFNLLDESCVLNCKDEDFLNNTKKMCEGHQNFPLTNNTVLKKCFIVRHTPGDIQYMVIGFRSKNKDFLRQDIVQKLSKSKSIIINDKFSKLYVSMKTEANKKFLGYKIRKQISNLITQMSSNSDMHFIRCIKPNDAKMPLTFVQRVCFNQIKYLGVLDTVRMRKDCYHVRIPYQQFYKKFGVLKGNNTQQMIQISSGNTGNIDFKQKVKQLIDGKFKSAQLDYLYGNQKLFMKMETNNYLQAVYKQKTKKLFHAATVIKVIFRNRHKRNERKNFTVHIRKVQLALRSYLRDIIMIKRKNAVKIIERQWIQRSEIFFRRKKMIPLKAIQKYIKKIVQKKKYEAQHNSIVYAKGMITNMKKTHEAADKFQLHLAIKKDFLSNIYDQIWKKMSLQYSRMPQKYFKTFSNNLKNRVKILSAQEKANNRILLRVRQTVQKYFKTIFWANRYQTLHNNIVKVQKYCRMSLYRKKHDLLDKMARIIQKNYRDYRIFKQYSMRKIMKYFRSVGERQAQWKSCLFRNLSQNKITQEISAVDQVMQKFQGVKKDKIVLFYFLIDVQLFCNEPSLDNWIQNYLYLFEDMLLKLNPLQYIDVSNTHTAVSSTSKVYMWGDINSQIQQYQLSQGKLAKVYASDGATRVDSINPVSQEFIGKNVNQKQLSNENKQWNTSTFNFVLLNGIVLTMHSTSFTKLNTPEKISQLSCGMGHVICKTILKKVYTWGSNQKGQLGTGDYFDTNSMQPRLVQYFFKKRIPVNQVAASPEGSIVLDLNSKLYWFGTNGTINMLCNPEEIFLNSKSIYIGNHVKYSPVRIVSRWSKTMSTIGITLACHDDILKNQISLRKKVLQNLMMKWSQDVYLINPPYSQSVADHVSERHMPLPSIYNGPAVNSRNPTNKQIRQQIINDIRKLQQAQKQLLRARKLQQKQEPRRRYG